MALSFRERIRHFHKHSDKSDLCHALYAQVATEYVMSPADQEDAIQTFARQNENAYSELYTNMEALEKKLDLASSHPLSVALMEIVKFAVDLNKKLYPTLEASQAAAYPASLPREALDEIHAHSDALLRPIAEEVCTIQERCYHSIGKSFEKSHDELVDQYVTYMNEQIANKAKLYLHREQHDQAEGQKPSGKGR